MYNLVKTLKSTLSTHFEKIDFMISIKKKMKIKMESGKYYFSQNASNQFNISSLIFHS